MDLFEVIQLSSDSEITNKTIIKYIYSSHTFTVSHKSEYTPYISAQILYLFKGQYYRNVNVNVQLVEQ